MKISVVNRDMTLKQGDFKLHSKFENDKDKSGKINDKKHERYNANYGGSFTGGVSGAATNTMKKGGMFASNWFNKFLLYTEEHNISTSALIALGLAGIARPATIMLLPGDKDREDKIYASGHSIASAIMGFIVSTIVTNPFDASISKVFKNPDFYMNKNLAKIEERLKELKNKCTYETLNKAKKIEFKKEYDNLFRKKENIKTLAKNIPGWIIAIPRSMLTIALIPPILKYVFGVEKKKKKVPQQDQVQMNNNQQNVKENTPKYEMDFVNKPIFQDFKGGVR